MTFRATDIWEPWRPEIGQRVRVRISAECREDWGRGPEGHPSWADGLTGIVVDKPYCVQNANPQALARHPYSVLLDEDGPGGTYGLRMAAIELEPIE
jgi:hypothetical protein